MALAGWTAGPGRVSFVYYVLCLGDSTSFWVQIPGEGVPYMAVGDISHHVHIRFSYNNETYKCFKDIAQNAQLDQILCTELNFPLLCHFLA